MIARSQRLDNPRTRERGRGGTFQVNRSVARQAGAQAQAREREVVPSNRKISPCTRYAPRVIDRPPSPCPTLSSQPGVVARQDEIDPDRYSRVPSSRFRPLPFLHPDVKGDRPPTPKISFFPCFPAISRTKKGHPQQSSRRRCRLASLSWAVRWLFILSPCIKKYPPRRLRFRCASTTLIRRMLWVAGRDAECGSGGYLPRRRRARASRVCAVMVFASEHVGGGMWVGEGVDFLFGNATRESQSRGP